MIVLVQCTDSKLDKPAQAKNLYSSDLFEAQRRYAESIADEWYILSAKHGLVDPRETLDPYNTRMGDVDSDKWANLVMSQFPDTEQTVKITAGSDYADPLVPELEQDGIEVHEPFRGMRMGPRINAMIEKARELENQSLDKYEA